MKRNLRRLVGACLLPACLLASGLVAPAAEEEEDGATFRTLVREYFDTGDGEALANFIGYDEPVKKVIALEYKVLLREGDVDRPVDPKLHEFEIGDRIRVEIAPLRDYYVYIFNVGPDGKQAFLLPDEQRNELAPLIKAGQPITLPDDGYLAFHPPAGTEQLMVVATEKRVADRATLAKVLTKPPGAKLTPEEEKLNATIKATVKEALISVREHQKAKADNTVLYRGFTTEDDQKKLVEDVRARGVKNGTFEEPSRDPNHGTSAMYVSTSADEVPRLLVSIPLKSVPARQ